MYALTRKGEEKEGHRAITLPFPKKKHEPFSPCSARRRLLRANKRKAQCAHVLSVWSDGRRRKRSTRGKERTDGLG
jgi:hypothetical protein